MTFAKDADKGSQRLDPVEAHREVVRNIVERIRKVLLTLPPEPILLFRIDKETGTIIPWRASVSVTEIHGAIKEFDAVIQHLKETEFSIVEESFLSGLQNYAIASKKVMNRIRESVRQFPDQMRE